MEHFRNGYPMERAFSAAVDEYIRVARQQGCTASDEAIRAAFECMVMDAADLPVDDETYRIAAQFNGDVGIDFSAFK